MVSSQRQRLRDPKRDSEGQTIERGGNRERAGVKTLSKGTERNPECLGNSVNISFFSFCELQFKDFVYPLSFDTSIQ